MSKIARSTATRTLGALALLVIGGVHYQVYRYQFYSSIPTIGPLFLVNFVVATALGLFLVVPVRPPGRLGALTDRLAALAGIGVSAGALVGLLISERTPLFGFREQGYRFVIVLALASEVMAIAMLSLFLARQRAHRRQPRTDLPPGPSGHRTAVTTDQASSRRPSAERDAAL